MGIDFAAFFIYFMIAYIFIVFFFSCSFFSMQSNLWHIGIIFQIAFVLVVAFYEDWVWKTVDLNSVPIRADILFLRPYAIFVLFNALLRLCLNRFARFIATATKYKLLQIGMNLFSFAAYFIYCYKIMKYSPTVFLWILLP